MIRGVSLFTGALVLLGGLSFIGIAFSSRSLRELESLEQKQAVRFDEFEHKLNRVNSERVPLGATEFESATVATALRYDRCGYWAIRDQGVDLYIYVAYWRAGKTSVREVAFHTPDHCWTNAGLRLDPLSRTETWFPKGKPSAAKQRKFISEKGSVPTYVAYWHIFGGRVVDYGDAIVPSKLSILAPMFRLGVAQFHPQWFVRVHSAVPLSSVASLKTLSTLESFLGELIESDNQLILDF